MGEQRLADGWRVDGRCTNCDVARQFAPGLIGEEGGRSVVLREPRDRADGVCPPVDFRAVRW